jgi:hypothetical protein
MKKHILILSTALLCINAFAQVPSYVPTNGLVGYWPFNSNANDESGNANNGNNVNGTFNTDRFNNINSAFYCSGNNSGVNITGLNNFPFGNSERTISVWFKCDLPYPGGDRHFFAYGGNNFGTRFSVYTTGDLIGVEYCNGAVRSTYTPDSLWHNILVTYNGNGSSGIIVYMDNQILPTNTLAPTLSINTENSFVHTIGCLFTANYFKGFLDDIGIWNRALTQCEIQDLYNAQLNSLAVSAGPDQTLCEGQSTSLFGLGASTYSWNNNVQNGVGFVPTATASYTVTGTDANGCIGTDTVNIVVNNNSSSTLNETALDLYTLNGQTYTQSGTYTQVIPNAAGCDSTITLNLSLDFTGLQELENSFTISPNPASNQLNVLSPSGINENYFLLDAQGRKVLTGKLTGTTTSIDISKLAAGNYLVQVGENKLPVRIVKN